MLLLGRRVGQRITINENVQVVVTAICDDYVTLGFSAPPGINIVRNEVKHDKEKMKAYELKLLKQKLENKT